MPLQLLEEAQAERDLFYSQRKKKIDAAMATNRRGFSSHPRVASDLVRQKGTSLSQAGCSRPFSFPAMCRYNNIIGDTPACRSPSASQGEPEARG